MEQRNKNTSSIMEWLNKPASDTLFLIISLLIPILSYILSFKATHLILPSLSTKMLNVILFILLAILTFLLFILYKANR